MAKTGRLRELLNEHEIEWIDDSYAQFLCTVWPGQDGKQWRMLERKGSEYTELKTWYATPEQAIVATLGSGTCKADETDTIKCWVKSKDEPNIEHMELIHVMECSSCGSTYEYVNGSYEFCPRCGKKVVDEWVTT